MKTIEQISRYAAQCSFSDDDWKLLLDWTRERFGGGRLHRCQSPKTPSTFNEFLSWNEDGFGSGDVVSYGNLVGVVRDSLPDSTTLACYLGLGNDLIVQELKVAEPSRLKHLSEEESKTILDQIYSSGQTYSVTQGRLVEMYTPEANTYVNFSDSYKNISGTGIYLESDGCRHHFNGVLVNGRFKHDTWLDLGYAPLRPVTNKDIHNFHTASVKAGWSYNARTGTFTPLTVRGGSNVYWYLTECFEVARDWDNGGKKHQARFKAGNYFLDEAEAISFMGEVMDIRKGRTSQSSLPNSKF